MTEVAAFRPHQLPPPALEEPYVPHSIEAEQQVLGAILTNNSILDRVGAVIGDADFYDPVHARIFACASRLIGRGELASPVTLKAVLGRDHGLAQLGGPAYLVRLAGAAISAFAAADYARLIRELSRKRTLVAAMDRARAELLEGERPLEEVATDIEAVLLEAAEGRRGAQATSWLKATTDAIVRVNLAYQGKAPIGVATGLGSLDRIIGTLDAGDLAILAGRPSMGKSSVALSIATAAARAGHPVVFASLEMSPEALALRGLSEATSLAGNAVPYSDARRGTLSEAQFRQLVHEAEALRGLPVAFLPPEIREATALRMAVRRELAKMPLPAMPLVVVDYLQLLDVKGASRYEGVTAASAALKALGMAEGVPVLALSQLSRRVEERDDKRPRLSDLRESGAIEQDADHVMFCYRDEYYTEREEPDREKLDKHAAWQERLEKSRGRLEIIVAKQRGGAVGTVHLKCALAMNRIWDPREPWDDKR